MTTGIGHDLIEIDRIRQSIERHGSLFLNRLFTLKEQAHCLQYKDSAPHFAGRFAAKEAIAKAYGTGFGEALSWLDIEILAGSKGEPIVKAARIPGRILVTISHTATLASAVAIWDQNEKGSR
jgi:holo-[acyl-carrier protein] synthase